MEEVGRKLYLSETPSIGREAKTPGAKRRISSAEIATVPGTVDLAELLFSTVLMLVDWLVGCSEPQQRGEALAERPADKGRKTQEPRKCGGRGFKWQGVRRGGKAAVKYQERWLSLYRPK
jgi:hypothetical protein